MPSIDDLVTSMSEAEFSTIEYGGYECSICLSADDDDAAPSMRLHCKHSFCSTCLRSHCLAQLQQQGRAFAPCPLCKTAMRKDEVARTFSSADKRQKDEFARLLHKAARGEIWQSMEDEEPPAPAPAPQTSRRRGLSLRGMFGLLWPSRPSLRGTLRRPSSSGRRRTR